MRLVTASLVSVGLVACQGQGGPAAVSLSPSPADPSAFASLAEGEPTPAAARPNILLVIADDVGVDQAACYSRPTTTRAPQPNLEALCARGVTYTRAWSNPLCSPTRASILTGRYAGRHGVGEPTGIESRSPGLSRLEFTLPQALDAGGSGYSHGAFGKWHLADDENGAIRHPNIAGFSHFAGGIDGQVWDFNEWTRVQNGVESTSYDYATSVTVDDALDWIGEQDGPWFAWVGFHAPHTPLHLPPDDLHSYDDLVGSYDDLVANPADYYQAMLEAMDTEMGRLFEGLGSEVLDNTIIIYVGDNGTEAEVNQDAYADDRSKGSLYQGGVHVPLVVAGPGIAGDGRREGKIVHTVDLFATVLDLAGVDMEAVVPPRRIIDAVSLVPTLSSEGAPAPRRTVLSEVFGPGTTGEGLAGQAVFDGRFKLIRSTEGEEELYDLIADPTEATDLLDGALTGHQALAWDFLAAELDGHPIDPEFDDEDDSEDGGEDGGDHEGDELPGGSGL